MSPLLAFWFGGAIASALIFAGEMAADDNGPHDGGKTASILVAIIVWPVTAIMFLIDVANGWRG